MKPPSKELVTEFLEESNKIENVWGLEPLLDAQAAWDYLMTHKELGVSNILTAHQILMSRLDSRIAGMFRHCDVWIGGKKKKFVTVYIFEENLKTLCNLMNMKADKKRTVEEKEGLSQALHVEFENIHPFEDGNGRTGRMLWNWHRLKLGLPLKVVHVGDEQIEYYRMFR